MAAVMPLLLGGDRRASSPTERGLVKADGRMRPGDRAATAPPNARSTSRSTTSSARSSACPVHVLRGLSADLPPTDFTIGIDEPDVVAERARARPTSRRSRSSAAGPTTSPRCERCARSSPGRSASTPTPAGRATTRRGAAARARRPRRRAHRAAVPGQGLPRPRLAPGALLAADRGRRVVRLHGGPRRARRTSSPASTSSSPSAAASGRPTRMLAEARARWASGRSLAAWRRRRSGSPPRRSSRSLAEWVDLDGNLLLADDPFEGLELGPGQALAALRPARASG